MSIHVAFARLVLSDSNNSGYYLSLLEFNTICELYWKISGKMSGYFKNISRYMHSNDAYTNIQNMLALKARLLIL
jgi:hypothetical protein